MIQDLLDYAQIKAGKFRKIISRFNIRETINRVMDMQRAKAEEQGLTFTSKFINVAQSDAEASMAMRSPMICTDQDRVM
jgi:signal transduction histidine kinase